MRWVPKVHFNKIETTNFFFPQNLIYSLLLCVIATNLNTLLQTMNPFFETLLTVGFFHLDKLLIHCLDHVYLILITFSKHVDLDLGKLPDITRGLVRWIEWTSGTFSELGLLALRSFLLLLNQDENYRPWAHVCSHQRNALAGIHYVHFYLLKISWSELKNRSRSLFITKGCSSVIWELL